jgi:Protein of unknown function (DUF2917)
MRNLSQCQPYQQCWVLPPGRAQTFISGAAGVLRVTAGRAWVTLGQGLAGDDVFLDGSTSLALQAGQVVVVEFWPLEPAAQLGLVWEAVPLGSLLTVPPIELLQVLARSLKNAARQLRWKIRRKALRHGGQCSV